MSPRTAASHLRGEVNACRALEMTVSGVTRVVTVGWAWDVYNFEADEPREEAVVCGGWAGTWREAFDECVNAVKAARHWYLLYGDRANLGRRVQ